MPPRSSPAVATPPPSIVRAFQWDLARQVERLDVLIGLLPQYAEWGYQELYLHLEDAVEYPSFPKIARSDAYRYSELKKLVEAATRVGIGVVPIINLLGHTQYLIKTPGLRDLNELRTPEGRPMERGQICPLHPRTLEVAEKLIRDMAPFCTAGKVHVGLDESFHLGKCPRCRAEIERHGLAYHFSEYVIRLHGAAQHHRLRLGLWADMLYFLPDAIPRLPGNVVAYDWFYYPFVRHPRVEMFNFKEVDLSARLRQQGIEYWGCPMNGAFRYEPLPVFGDRLANIRSWWNRCHRTGAAGMLITSWEAYRLALAMPATVDAAAASLWLDSDGTRITDAKMLERGFARIDSKKSPRRAAKSALAADLYPFSGYARWEINRRWDTTYGTKHPRETKIERAYFARLAKTNGIPEALSASLDLRSYLASRDHFVTVAAEGMIELRQRLAKKNSRQFETLRRSLLIESKSFSAILREGRRAARQIWQLSRAVTSVNQNEEILAGDQRRLNDWISFLKALEYNPGLAFAATTVCGCWQLIFKIHNFAPAAQRVSVEARQADGKWHELHARHTMEFQARAAQTRTDIVRPFSVPVDAPETELCIVVAGVGQVRISDPLLTNGVERRLNRKREFTLGRKAPSSGFPDPSAVRTVHPLVFT